MATPGHLSLTPTELMPAGVSFKAPRSQLAVTPHRAALPMLTALASALWC